jgi:hypothetical protein
MANQVRVLTDAEFSVFRKYACVRCGHFMYCFRSNKFQCSLGFPLTEVFCVSFVRKLLFGLRRVEVLRYG